MSSTYRVVSVAYLLSQVWTNVHACTGRAREDVKRSGIYLYLRVLLMYHWKTRGERSKYIRYVNDAYCLFSHIRGQLVYLSYPWPSLSCEAIRPLVLMYRDRLRYIVL